MDLPADEFNEVILVGTEYHPETFEGREVGPAVFELRREPDNPHDPQAVAAFLEGRLAGYLSRSQARAYGPALGRLEGRAPLTIAGRADVVRGAWWAWVRLPRAEEFSAWADSR